MKGRGREELPEKRPHPFGLPPEEEPAPATGRERFFRWFANTFWYHYKWHVLGGLAVVLLVVFFAYTMTAKDTPDFQYAVASSGILLDADLESLTAAAEQLIGDRNGDGRAHVQGHALYMRAEGNAVVENYVKLATLMVDESIRFFLFDRMLLSSHFGEPDGLEDLSARGYETLPGYPWVAEVAVAALADDGGASEETYCVAIQSGADPEVDMMCYAFLDLILQTP